VGLGGKSAADKGKDTRDYLAAAFPELNAWERAGADASSAGMVDAGFENQKELTKMQLDNQKEIAEMQNETQKEIAGIDRKSGSAGMPRPISYAVFCLKKTGVPHPADAGRPIHRAGVHHAQGTRPVALRGPARHVLSARGERQAER